MGQPASSPDGHDDGADTLRALTARPPGRSALAIRNARIYLSPDQSPLEQGTVVVRDGRIVAVGPTASVPEDCQVIPAEGRVVTAGFWNAHVHFTETKWRSSARGTPALLNGLLRDMFTSRGFTTVVDTGSDPRFTLRVRQRIETDEVLGPRIYTSGSGIFPPRGIPYYVRNDLRFWVRPFVPQPSTPSAAMRITRRNIARGADLLKLFTGSYVARGEVRTMPEPIARAAAAVAHANHQVVYSHPSNLDGTRVAIRAGVDVLAHPPDTTEGVDEALLREMIDRGMAMIPTLKMFADTVGPSPTYLEPIYEIVRRYHRLGGQLVFGTDVGYMRDYATDDEFRALGRSGVDSHGVLKMLTTAPAERFGVGNETGSIAVGKQGDLVLLEGDPMEDLLAFSRVTATIRAGRLLYLRPPSPE